MMTKRSLKVSGIMTAFESELSLDEDVFEVKACYEDKLTWTYP